MKFPRENLSRKLFLSSDVTLTSVLAPELKTDNKFSRTRPGITVAISDFLIMKNYAIFHPLSREINNYSGGLKSDDFRKFFPDLNARLFPSKKPPRFRGSSAAAFSRKAHRNELSGIFRGEGNKVSKLPSQKVKDVNFNIFPKYLRRPRRSRRRKRRFDLFERETSVKGVQKFTSFRPAPRLSGPGLISNRLQFPKVLLNFPPALI